MPHGTCIVTVCSDNYLKKIKDIAFAGDKAEYKLDFKLLVVPLEPPFLTIVTSNIPLWITNKEMNFELHIKTNVGLTAVATDSWIKIDPIAGSIGNDYILTGKIGPNNTGGARTGMIVLNPKETTKTIVSIYQSQHSIIDELNKQPS